MSEQPPTCMVCSQEMRLFLDRMFDDRYGYDGYFELMQCHGCGQIETRPMMREEQLPELYAQYYPRSNLDMEVIAGQVGCPGSLHARVSRWLDGTNNQGQYYTGEGQRVLDYGCGTGLSLLEVKQLGGVPYGIETDPNISPVAEHFGLNIHIGNLDDNPFPGIKFDLIVMNQVIEHVPEPVRLLKKFVTRLAPGGVIILSFPNAGSVYRILFGRKWINWHLPYHLHHFNKNSFLKFCRANGFRLISFQTVTPNLWTLLQLRVRELDLHMGVPVPLWTGTASDASVANNPSPPSFIRRNMTRVYNRLFFRPLRLLRTIIFAVVILVVNRVLDFLNQGDCIVAVLKPEIREGR